MNQRKLFLTTLILAIAIILCIGIFSFTVSKLKFNSDKLLSNVDAREYNSIIAAKQPFDAVILGTSMSQGFHCSDLDAACGCQSLKLTCNGSSLAEIKFLADYARKYRKLKYVLLDCHLFTYAQEQTLDKMPLQLYSPQADLFLLKQSFSINLLSDNIEFVSRYLRGKVKVVSRDALYDWNSKNTCGEKQLARAVLFKTHKVYDYNDEFISKAKENIKKHLLPLFQESPETRFFLFFPPYSAMFYRGSDPAGYIRLKEAVMELLLTQKNVELYDFQTEFSITENLECYEDLTHYSGRINAWMIAQIKKKSHLVTPENRKKLLAKHLEQLKQYDYQGTYKKLDDKYGKKKKKK